MASASTNTISVNHPLPGCQSPAANCHHPAGIGGYLEYVANVSSWLRDDCDAGRGWFVPGEDVNGHRFGKEIVCGKEWCPRCGEDRSTAHDRRFQRWLGLGDEDGKHQSGITHFKTMGYFVFTLPEDVRGAYRTKKALSRLGHQVQELLKSCGYHRGLRRWHFFGDKSTKWHPHLNILVDGAWLAPAILDRIKQSYAKVLGVDVVDVYYRYRCGPGKMMHTLRYITRATFRDYTWDERMAMELRGFRNMVVWGRGQWNDDTWKLDKKLKAEVGMDTQAIEHLAKGLCPVCGEPIKWGDVLPMKILEMTEGKVSLGAGYWRLPDNVPREEWLRRKVRSG